MANIIIKKSKQILTRQDLADIQQPLNRDGYTNDYFDKLYGPEKNPSVGTERDRSRRKIGVSRGIKIAPEIQEKIIKAYKQLKRKTNKTAEEKERYEYLIRWYGEIIKAVVFNYENQQRKI